MRWYGSGGFGVFGGFGLRALRWRRHPLWFWLVTLGLAMLTAATAMQVLGRASAAVDRWGRLASVAVVVREVPAGVMVAAADVRVETVPERLVPSGAVLSVDDVVGRVAVVALWPGEIVLRGRLAPDGLVGVAALVPVGMRAVALPVIADGSGGAGGGLRVRVGDTVDVLATFDVAEAEAEAEAHDAAAAADAAAESEAADVEAAPNSIAPTVVVAEAVSVVDVQAESVTVAVPAADAPRLAYAAARATLTLALTPLPPPPVRQSTAPAAVDYREPGR